jgi:hypothetical protein
VIETTVAAFRESSHHRIFDLAELLERQYRERGVDPIVVWKACSGALLPCSAPQQDRGADELVAVKGQELGRHEPFDVEIESVEICAVDVGFHERRRKVVHWKPPRACEANVEAPASI